MSDSIWKKELSFRRKPKEEVEERAAIPASWLAAEPVASPVEPSSAVVEPSAPVVEAAASAVPDSAASDPATPDSAAPAAAELPAQQGDYGWLTSSFDPSDVPDEMPKIAPPPVSGPPHEPVGAVPEVELAPVVPPPPAVAPTAGSPPAAEPSVDAPTSASPFWKQELSFGRGRKEPKPAKGQKQPKPAKQPKPPKEPKAAKEPKEHKPPLWKRELKFERGPKEPKGPKEPRVKQEKAARNPGSSKTGIVGLKIGASQVAAARVSNNGSPHLLQIARADLPDGVVVGGELRDIETLAVTLKEMFAKHKLPKRGIRLGIANNRIGVRTFEISGIDDPKQLANAIRFRAQETLPIPLEEAVLDWQLLSEWTDEETGQTVRRVLLVVAYRELVERYVLACKKAGIRVAGIDLEAFAMLRALSEPPASDAPAATGAQVVVNVGHDRSTFAVSDGRVCEFTRVLGWGGQNLSVAIARALDMAPSEARPIKHALSLVAQSTPPEGISQEALGVAREAVTRELQSFARELVSSLRFYQNQPGSLGIGQLVLTGGSAHLPGFADELQKLIGVPVSVGDPLNRVVIPKKFREPEYAIGSLTVAIGLGIED